LIRKVCILGNHIQALGLARQVKDLGINVLLFTDSRYSVARYSNAVDKTVLFHDEADLYNKILSADENEKEPLLFPTNDQMVEFLCRNHSRLNKDFHLGIPEPETVGLFYDKRNTCQFAAEHDIPIPATWCPDTMDELEAIAKDISYPVVLKPAVMHSFHKALGKKAFKCSTSYELMDRAREIGAFFSINEMIIQEYLAGGAKTLFSYGVFAAQGKPIASLMANRIRQNPMDFGNSTTYAKTCNIEEIRQISEKILSLTNYFGLAEIEFMHDPKTGKYKFLEINPRAWKWHSISNGLGFSFIGKMISYLNSGDTSVINDYEKQIAWVERLTDSAVVLKEIVKGRMRIKEVLDSYKKDKVYPVWSQQDIKPFFMYLVLASYLYLKRH
jgi:predicted ATP-grasp superfamily ATP-dependent carboligase